MERTEIHRQNSKIDQELIHNLPLSAKIISWVGSHWPFAKGRGRLNKLMESSLSELHGLIEVQLKDKNGEMRIIVPIPDHSSSLLATFKTQDLNLQNTINQILQLSGSEAAYFIDIGANLGIYSLSAAFCSKAKVIAFEPQTKLYELIESNAKRLSLDKLITVRNTALGDIQGHALLKTNSYDVGQARVTLDSEIGEHVIINTLDNEIDCTNIDRIALIKIDVEGYESKVIEGSRKTLSLKQIPIIFELNLKEYYSGAINSIQLLKELGYNKFYCIDSKIYPIENGVLPISNILALSSSDNILSKISIDHNYKPRSTKNWSLSSIIQ